MACFAMGANCVSDKYADVKKTYTVVIKIHDDMSKAIERAHSSKEVANAITTFSASLIALKPELLKIQEKYPELNNEETIPQELKPLMANVKTAGENADRALSKVFTVYEKNVDVQSALQKMGKALNP
jgi:hypothetical protein